MILSYNIIHSTSSSSMMYETVNLDIQLRHTNVSDPSSSMYFDFSLSLWHLGHVIVNIIQATSFPKRYIPSGPMVWA